MAYLLHIDASLRGKRSHSRHMTCKFVQQWKQQHPNDAIAYRDVGRNPTAHVDTGNVYKPLVLGKKMYITYLVTVFGFTSITDITFIHIKNDDYGGQKLTESIANARHRITKLVAA